MPLRRTIVSVVSLTWLLARPHSALTSPVQPNVLWILCEDVGPSAFSCYREQPPAATPEIDQLAASGVRYNRFYTTAPVCSASRSAFMTGMYQNAIGAHDHRTQEKQALPEGVHLLPDLLSKAGYFTANIREFPEKFGFKGTGKTDWNFLPNITPPFEGRNWEELKKHQPFFAQVNFFDPHRPFEAKELTNPELVRIPPYYPDHPLIRKDYAKYLDAARQLDANVGRLLRELDRSGLADRTVVILMGDNGEAHIRGKQFCYEEGLRVPMIIRWPSGLPAPNHYTAGDEDQRLLEAIDVAPTILSLTGIAIPPKMQGRPFLGDAAGKPKEYVYGARDRCDETEMTIRTVRSNRYRYIRTLTPEVPFFAPNAYKARFYPAWTLIPELHAEGKLTPAQAFLCQPSQPGEQLYDMERDPNQIHNLVPTTDPTLQTILSEHRSALHQWMEATQDHEALALWKPAAL